MKYEEFIYQTLTLVYKIQTLNTAIVLIIIIKGIQNIKNSEPRSKRNGTNISHTVEDDCIYLDKCEADHDKYDDCEGWIECNRCNG